MSRIITTVVLPFFNHHLEQAILETEHRATELALSWDRLCCPLGIPPELTCRRDSYPSDRISYRLSFVAYSRPPIVELVPVLFVVKIFIDYKITYI